MRASLAMILADSIRQTASIAGWMSGDGFALNADTFITYAKINHLLW